MPEQEFELRPLSSTTLADTMDNLNRPSASRMCGQNWCQLKNSFRGNPSDSHQRSRLSRVPTACCGGPARRVSRSGHCPLGVLQLCFRQTCSCRHPELGLTSPHRQVSHIDDCLLHGHILLRHLRRDVLILDTHEWRVRDGRRRSDANDLHD